MTVDINPLGIPIEGDIITGRERVDQRPVEELRPLIEAVFTHPDVVSVQWRQYTPYFNDGDECVFGTWSDYAFVRMVGMTDNDGDDEDGFVDIDDARVKGGVAKRYIPGVIEYDKHTGRGTQVSPARYEEVGTFERSDAYDDLYMLQSAIGSGQFDNVLYDLFGDHASVVVSRDKIVVSEYSHD